MTFVGGHAVWSIAVPIAVVETLVPERRTTPWLGRAGLTVTAVVFLVGATAIFRDQTEQFLATVPQMAGTVAAAAALVPAAFAVGRRPGPRWTGPSPGRAWPPAWGSSPSRPCGRPLVTAHRLVRHPPPGPGRRALTAYLWGGFALLAFEGAATTFNLAGQLLLVLGTAALLLAAARTARRASPASIHHA
jgi:hypothetical protein